MNKRILEEIKAFKLNKEIKNAFIKVNEEDIRSLKFMIIGCEGTPYENGYFIFDLTFPPTYPMEPPKVVISNTAGGKVRFNPNLYANGKVCLSLINTWGSNDWTPANNLTSVILSIQGLVFTDSPLKNEPSYENSSEESNKNYNRYVRYLVLEYAIYNMVMDKENPFRNVILETFTPEVYTKVRENLQDEIDMGKIKYHNYMSNGSIALPEGGNFKNLISKIESLVNAFPKESAPLPVPEGIAAKIVGEKCTECDTIPNEYVVECETCGITCCPRCASCSHIDNKKYFLYYVYRSIFNKAVKVINGEEFEKFKKSLDNFDNLIKNKNGDNFLFDKENKLWIPLKSKRSVEILLNSPQKIIYFQEKVFNKNTKKWVLKKGKSAKDYIASVEN